MKKSFIYLLVVLVAGAVLVSLGVLSGCSKTDRLSLDQRIGEAEQQAPTSYEGVIQPLGNLDVYQEGTHQLVTEDQGAIIIQSRTIDLSQYLNEKVIVKGVLGKGKEGTKDVLTVTSIAYADTSKSAETQTYENKSFNFEFSYPSTWTLSEQTDGVSLNAMEKKVVEITVFSDQTDLEAFTSGREKTTPAEVTVGGQKALRFTPGTGMNFYVPNSGSKEIILIAFTPSVNSVDDQQGADAEKTLFYNLLDSFQLTASAAQVQGSKCGGKNDVKCPDQQICQLESNDPAAEGVCMPIGGKPDQTNCPYIAPPADCKQYKISEYSQKGCPTRYECTDQPAASAPAAATGGQAAGTAPPAPATTDQNTVPVSPDAGTSVDSSTETKTYTVPDISEVTAVYANARKGFSLLIPKKWYYSSFGAVDGALWKVGFADTALEDETGAIITLSLMNKDGGVVSRKIGDTYYVLDGPSDLKEVMQKMADSIEVTQ